ncbi:MULTISPECIES: family 20 glycosylhydrolase [unclassified Sphingobacterium]|uniref:family 20 glycosylhydrolase n=1 Tax=unclassified Sphingobacterium TaxID=2609468 RepID=UPI0025D71C77|nr:MULTISPECIES: family 20 glycosylhydrolase [unclassified Sphingobacterium]
MNKILSTILLSCALYLPTTNFAQNKTTVPQLIPFPQQLASNPGLFQLKGQELGYYIDPALSSQSLSGWIDLALFGKLNKKSVKRASASLQLIKGQGLSDEGYELKIDQKGIQIIAASEKGAFYGLQTIQQLYLLSGTTAKLALPYITVKDQPAFQWRGVELDVARHFFPKEYLYKFIDLIASYKFNKFHLHLTDDQGWRIEIKKYPKLTEDGAWRTYNNQDSACFAKAKENPDFNLPKELIRTRNGKEEYGGFYTQQDIRDIVAYAQRRQIEIIPEIDMPGHMMVATKAYPELLLDSQTAGWGKQFSVPISPWKESSYTFVKHVLSEIIELFPSPYIHIGADEVEKDSWAKSAAAKAFMVEKQIANLHDLQSYFIKRVNNFIRSKNKQSIGWDEILDGSSDTSMMVMYWRGWEKNAPKEAVNRGHRVIMTPTNPLYFDYLPNSSSLDAVYNMSVVPSDISNQKAHLIQGAQANIWTEMIPSTARLEFMILPRLSALSERVWTNKPLYDSYRNRVISHFGLWDKMGLRYRMPDLEGFAETQVIVDGQSILRVENELPQNPIHYSTDGSLPTQQSPVLKDSLVVKKEGPIRFATISSSGANSELYQINFKYDTWKKSVRVDETTLIPGLKATFFNGTFANTSAIAGPEVRHEVISNVALSDTIKIPSFGAKIRGYLYVKEKGIYNFYFTCDDGGVLRIHDQLVVDNDGQHAPIMKSGQIALEAGYHPIAVDFIEAGGGFTLKLQYSVKDSPVIDIPKASFFHQKD